MAFGGHRRRGPPSADGTCRTPATRKVPIITAVRIAIFTTSFAFVIVFFLWDLGDLARIDRRKCPFQKHEAFQTHFLVPDSAKERETIKNKE